MEVLSERFSWFWVSYGLINFLVGVLLALIVVVTLKRKGVVVLLVVPLAIHLMLWSTWAAVRHTLVVDWLIQRNQETQFDMGMANRSLDLQIGWYYFLSNALWTLCFALAFVPYFIKDKAPVVPPEPL